MKRKILVAGAVLLAVAMAVSILVGIAASSGGSSDNQLSSEGLEQQEWMELAERVRILYLLPCNQRGILGRAAKTRCWEYLIDTYCQDSDMKEECENSHWDDLNRYELRLQRGR